MKRRIFRELMSIEEAKKKLHSYFDPQPIRVTSTPLPKANGRILAENVEAQIDVPPFDRASMDGFAVLADDTFGAEEENPVVLEIIGKVEAGDYPVEEIEKGKAIEISTGAPMPKGANAVVMVEYTWRRSSILKVYNPVSPGENIMSAGSDIMAGELILRKGTLLTPRDTGILASLGIKEVNVLEKPIVAIISTGNEIVTPGKTLGFGEIYDVNGRSIADSVKECGGESLFLGVVGDDPNLIEEYLKDALGKGDVVVASGGTSAGIGDLLYRILNRLGKPGIIVHGVSIRPGKPIIIAIVQGKPVFGLPGYPTSALVTFNIFVRPLIRSMAGLKPKTEKTVLTAKNAMKLYLSEGRREFISVNIVEGDTGNLYVYPVPGGSGAITTLAKADGFIEIPEDRIFLESGEEVNVELFSKEIKPADLTIIGSHCIGIDVLLEILRRNLVFSQKVINVGSTGGFAAIRRGEADIAGIHLMDEETGIYNLPFIEKYKISKKSILIRGYTRQQGFIIAKENPKGIEGLQDVIRNDVSFINRNVGSGTRILLDSSLKALSNNLNIPLEELISKINGYRIEAKSHTSVALAVLQNRADMGLGIRTVADRYGLDFISLATENYDFLIQKRKIKQELIQAFINTLKETVFKEELDKVGSGLTITSETGQILFP